MFDIFLLTFIQQDPILITWVSNCLTRVNQIAFICLFVVYFTILFLIIFHHISFSELSVLNSAICYSFQVHNSLMSIIVIFYYVLIFLDPSYLVFYWDLQFRLFYFLISYWDLIVNYLYFQVFYLDLKYNYLYYLCWNLRVFDESTIFLHLNL